MAASASSSPAGLTVVVTGASSGIGRGTALALAAQGARVVVVGRRADALANLVADISADGGTAIAVPADVADAAQLQAVGDAAEDAFGGFDVWINNAGVVAIGWFWEVPLADHARVADVNLTGVMNGSHVALRHFLARGSGTLLNVGSVEGDVPLALQSSYAATKAGVLSLGRSLRAELRLAGAPKAVRIGTILPWAIDTPLWGNAANYTGHAARMARLDDPRTVVDAIVRACSAPRAEQAVGLKAHGSRAMRAVAPHLATRVAGDISLGEMRRGQPVPHTSGSLHEPQPGGATVDGGVRARMAREDADEE
jgi:short-subunit dehydrogenase